MRISGTCTRRCSVLRNSVGLLVVVVVLFLLPLGCATDRDGVPRWVTTPPSAGEDFIGLSASSTGVMDADMERSREDATRELSKMVFQSLQTEGEGPESPESISNTTGWELEEVVEAVDRYFEQHPDSVETYHSPEKGGWHYLRLSEEEWESALQLDRTSRIDSIVEMTEAVADTTEKSVVEQVQTMTRGVGEAESSPHEETLEGTLLGSSGSLSSILRGEISKKVAGLKIVPYVRAVEVEIGRPSMIGLDIQVPGGGTSGSIPLELVDSSGSRVGRITTDADGGAWGAVDLEGLRVGTNSLAVRPVLEEIGVNSVWEGEAPVYTTLIVDVPAPEVFLNIEFHGDIGDPLATIDAVDKIRGIFTNRTHLSLIPEKKLGGYELLVDVYYSSDEALRREASVDIQMVATLVLDGSSVGAATTGKYSGTASTWSRAAGDALESLLLNLAWNYNFFSSLAGGIHIDRR